MTELPKLRTVGAQQVAEHALSAGFPVTCATCEHLKAAWECDAENCGKLLTCGGPIFGRCFPDYVGPLTKEAMESICLKCGSPDVTHHAYGGIRRLGLCFQHKSIFDKIDAPGTQQPVVVRVPGRSL